MNKAFDEILERLDKRCNVTVVSKEEKLPFSNVIANPLITEKDYNTNITIKEAKQIVQEVAKEYKGGCHRSCGYHWVSVKKQNK